MKDLLVLDECQNRTRWEPLSVWCEIDLVNSLWMLSYLLDDQPVVLISLISHSTDSTPLATGIHISWLAWKFCKNESLNLNQTPQLRVWSLSTIPDQNLVRVHSQHTTGLDLAWLSWQSCHTIFQQLKRIILHSLIKYYLHVGSPIRITWKL